MSELPRCDIEIFDKGTAVFMLADVKPDDIELWVRRLAELSGQRVDWYYAGGRAVVKCIGDAGCVRTAICRTINDLLPPQGRTNYRFL